MFRNSTLRMQLNVSIFLILLISFMGSVILNISNSQSFLEQQLITVSEHTGIQLATQLKPHLIAEDYLEVKTLVDVSFSNQALKLITVRDNNNQIIYERHIDVMYKPVKWFLKPFYLTTKKHSEVMNDELLMGYQIEVTANVQHVNAQLLDSVLYMSLFTLILFFIALLLGYFLLQQVYAPIRAISEQAKLVQQRDFIEIEVVPHATELKELVNSMNLMVKNIRDTFEELTFSAEATRTEAYIDHQTGIANRRSFDDQFGAYLAPSSEHRGFIGLVRINNLSQLNKVQGYQAGEKLIKDVIHAIELSNTNSESFHVYRLTGSELCFSVKNYSPLAIQSICQLLVSQLQQIEATLYNETDKHILPLGMLEFDHNKELDSILTALDTLLLEAEKIPDGCIVEYLQPLNNNESTTSSLQKSVIDKILLAPKTSIRIKSQKVYRIGERKCFDYEIFASFIHDKKELPAPEVFYLAGKYDLACAVDEAIINCILFYLPRFILKDEVLALNLSHLTFANKSSVLKLIKLLKESKKSQHFVIQVHERSIVDNTAYAKEILLLFKEIGCEICINHFGSSVGSLQYLIEIQPHFVKLAPSLTRQIDKKSNNLQLISAFVRMAHGLNISVLAHCVETEEELNMLKTLRLDAALGYAIEKPKTKVNFR